MNFLRIIHHNFLRIIRRNDLIVTFTYGNIKKVFNNFKPCEDKIVKVLQLPREIQCEES